MIKSLRFMSLLVISLALFALNGIYFSQRISQRQELFKSLRDYASSSKKLENIICLRELPMLAFLAEGNHMQAAVAYDIRVTGELTPFSLKEVPSGFGDTSTRNDFLPDAPPLDWLYIVTVLFSLYAIIFGYRAIAGEREQGTLGLVVSNPVRRVMVLIAKYAAIMTTLVIPLACGMILSMMLLNVNIPGIINGILIHGIILSSVIMIAYLSVFILFSLFVSSVLRQPAMVLLVTLSGWLVLSMVPSLSALLAKRISAVRPPYQFAREYSHLRQQYDINAFYRRIRNNEFNTVAEAETALDKQMQDGARLRKQLINQYEASVMGQLLFARSISRFSPMALIQNSLEAVSGVGLARELRFKSAALGFLDAFREYVKGKTGLGEIPDALGRWLSGFPGGGKVNVNRRLPTFEGDLDDNPHFTFTENVGRDVLKEAGGDLAGLLIWNIVLVVSASVFFSRADVR
jgi:ABC-type transport system involved in multi-copper enzyme maturation permease subunit